MTEQESQQTQPSSTPPTAPPPPGSLPESGASEGDALKTYNMITDKVAGPSIRLGDNIASLIGAVVGGLIGVVVAYFMAGNTNPNDIWIPLLVGGMGGAFVGLVLVGFVLMIIGLVRRS